MSREDVRNVIRRIYVRKPRWLWVMRGRNFGIMALTLLAWFWMRAQELNVVLAMLIAGGLSFSLTLAWNLVWLNTVLFRMTKEEIDSRASRAGIA